MSEKDLYNFVSDVSGDTFLKVEEALGDGFVRLRISEAERRQAKHDIRCVEDIIVELLRNSRDAGAHHIFVSSMREGDTRLITVLDDGEGIPKEMQERVFEPRVTSKLETMVIDQWGVHGRGMALYSIKSNVSSVKVCSSGSGLGASVGLRIDLGELTERKDQSTWSVLERTDEGKLQVSGGPHNILRRILEFALENRDLEVYIGTPTEIAATLYTFAKKESSSSEILFCDDLEELPVCKRLAGCSDSSEIVTCTASLGISISERTAHRVIGGAIPPLSPALSRLLGKRTPAREEARTPDIYRDRRGLKLSEDDLDEFARKLEDAFEVVGSRYYVGLKDLPKITVNKDKIRVTFEVEKED